LQRLYRQSRTDGLRVYDGVQYSSRQYGPGHVLGSFDVPARNLLGLTYAPTETKWAYDYFPDPCLSCTRTR